MRPAIIPILLTLAAAYITAPAVAAIAATAIAHANSSTQKPAAGEQTRDPFRVSNVNQTPIVLAQAMNGSVDGSLGQSSGNSDVPAGSLGGMGSFQGLGPNPGSSEDQGAAEEWEVPADWKAGKDWAEAVAS